MKSEDDSSSITTFNSAPHFGVREKHEVFCHKNESHLRLRGFIISIVTRKLSNLLLLKLS